MAPFNENEAEESAGEQPLIDPGPEGDFDETTGRKAWAVFHEEYFRKVLGYRDRRGELREKTDRVLGELGVSTDYGPGYPAGDMDPFTLVSKVASSDRKRFERGRRGYELIKGEFGLAARVPSDLNGLPRYVSSQAVFSRFTDMSWEFFEAAMTYRDEQSPDNKARFVEAFDAITREGRTGVWVPKATVALFGMDPYFYPILDSCAREYYREFLGIVDGSDVKGGAFMHNLSGEDYLRVKGSLERKCPGRDFRRISYEARIESERSKGTVVKGLFDDVDAPEGLSEDGRRWLEVFKDKEVSTPFRMTLLGHFAERGGSASYGELSRATGVTLHQYESNLVRFGEAVMAKYEGLVVLEEGQGPRYAFFNCTEPESGTNWREDAVWTLKPEIMEVFGILDGHLGSEAGDCEESEGQPPLEVRPTDLNTIFYGPPGTGKTFAAKRRAVEIVSGRDDIGEGEYARLYERYCSEGRIRMVTFHQSYSYEDFVCGICPSLSGGALSYRLCVGSFLGFCYPGLQSQVDASGGSPLPTEAIEKGRPLGRRVLIIDEINRGNVASIFGELMTLLEGSKRLGGPDQSRASVPSLGSEVGVPGEVYVIGTMNTADRSLVYLDAALRRRFRFVEMQPRADLVGDVDGVRLGEVLSEINRRIELLLDRDHAMGHSEFMAARTLDDVRELFAQSVIPLLQDYFFDDYGRIVSVLSRKGRPAVSDFVRSEADGSFGEERRLFRITPPEGWTAETFNGIVGEGDGQRPGSGRRVGAHSHRPR